MKIYTKKGDQGQTSLIGGTRVLKSHLRVEAYGAVDELNSWLGLLGAGPLPEGQGSLLLQVQERLFTLGANLAADPGHSSMALPDLRESDIEALEQAIDTMESTLEPLRNFVLPGGHAAVAQVHIARCVCRRAERSVVNLAAQSPVDALVTAYLNRLSDYLFVLARAVSAGLKVPEIPWKPRG
jgi:cob(I)alamin adenosyltransferase